MNYRLVALVFGEIALVLGALMCIPMFMAVGYGESAWTIGSYCIAIGICALLGGAGLALRPPKDKRDMRPSSGFALCGLLWVFITLLGALPFCLSRAIPSYIDALFETVSGFTTTGASILTNVEGMPKSLLFWRALIQWLGGMGVLVFVIAILPRNDKMSTALARAEIPGPQFGKLVSKLRFTTRILYAIYIALTLVLVGVLCACKMPVFDSFCHAFSTASTGGFSVRNASIAAYNSVPIEVTITVFMLLFSVNFNIYYFLLIGHFLKALKNEELFWMLGIYASATVLITLDLCVSHTYSIEQAIRYSTFNVATVMSTTGFGTADFTQWPVLSQAILLAVMCVGGCAGSTAGGLKVSRFVILSKTSFGAVKRTISPRSVYSLKLDGKPVDEETLYNVRSFLVLYIFVLVISTLLVSIGTPAFSGVSGQTGLYETNFSAVISCLNNIGPGIGAVGPAGNFAGYGVFSKLVLIFDMLLGRLEILPILLLFAPGSWRRVHQ